MKIFPKTVQEKINQLEFIDIGRAEDITGQTFERLYVLGRAPKPEGSKETKAFWWCICLNDNNIIKVLGKSLRTGNTKSCGCYNKEQISKKLLKDITNQKFGRLTVLYRDPNNTTTNVKWVCQCECGNLTSVKRGDIERGKIKSCGCLKKELSQNHLEGERFGKLTVIKEVPNLDKNSSSRQTKWLCKCDCGNFIEVTNNHLTSGNTKSCGCLTSVSEAIIEKYFNKYHIDYKRQYSFPDCRGKIPLKFDFAVFKNNKLLFLLEYQGIQHFENVYHLSEQDWLWSLERDNIKNQYCINNNIDLIKINYNDNLKDKLKWLLKDYCLQIS